MHIGIAGPMSLDLLRPHLPPGSGLPEGYPFPLISQMVSELLHRGHEVTAYTTSTDIREPFIVSNRPFTLCVVPSRPRHRAKTLFRQEIDGLVNAMRAHPCDLVHAQWTYEFASAALASGLPSLVTVHDWATAILLQHRDAYRLVRWGMNAFTVRQATHLTAVSPYLWEHLPRAARQRTTVIPNFVPDAVLDRTTAAAPRENYIISVCNGFSRRKNLQNGLLAFGNVRATLKDVKYLLVGHGSEPGGPAYSFCEAHGCLDNVVFAGPASHDRVLDLIGKALLMVHPAYEEACSVAVLESMALGTPVIGGRESGGIPHMVEHGRTGHLCDVADPASIACAMLTLAGDDHLRRSLGDAAQEEARRNYSASVIVSRYLDAYREVLAGSAAAQEVPLCA